MNVKRTKNVVAKDTLRNGVRVSTVLVPSLGLFESMVFPPKGWSALDMNRYADEEEARIGHDALVEQWESADASSIYPAVRDDMEEDS